MTTKIYCNKCRHLGKERDLSFYDQILFKSSDKSISSSTDICIRDVKIEVFETDEPVKIRRFVKKLVDDPEDLNNMNSCEYFEERLISKICGLLNKSISVF